MKLTKPAFALGTLLMAMSATARPSRPRCSPTSSSA